ncbi:MAG: hypothetical protein VKJ06_04170 [Vampirovibrionales bacterium]|nr:hypothetical protein [Vampirovibrionales bacterium]
MTQPETLYEELKQLLPPTLPQKGETDVYDAINALRDWINLNLPDFECYLEDVWNEREDGQTWIETILRSRRTFNETDPLAYDAYLNQKDDKGVWHLGQYQYSKWNQTPEATIELITQFVNDNLPTDEEEAKHLFWLNPKSAEASQN